MPEPSEAPTPVHDDPVIAADLSPAQPLPPPVGTPVAMDNGEPAAAPVSPPAGDSEHRSHSKMKAAALLASAAAVANKVRHEAPKKVQEIREKRVAGRHVILTEFEGGTIAIGPYRTDELARTDARRLGGVPTVIELRSPVTHFGAEADGQGDGSEDNGTLAD